MKPDNCAPKKWATHLCLLCATATIVMGLMFGQGVALAADSPSAIAGEGDTLEEPLPRLPDTMAAGSISSESVSKFVDAYLNVLNLLDERASQLRLAETEMESLRIQQELEDEAIALIEEAGLTWQEYVQLLNLANTDPDFSERVAAQLQETTTD